MADQDNKKTSNWPSIGGSRVALLIILIFGIAVAMILFIRYTFL